MAERKDKTADQEAAEAQASEQQVQAPATEEKPKKQQPSIGRVVHYVTNRNPVTGVIEDRHLTALITDPEHRVVPRFNDDGTERDPVQALVVFPPMAPPYPVTAIEGDPNEEGTWHWPEYVPAK